jgi:hypothetical protein
VAPRPDYPHYPAPHEPARRRSGRGWLLAAVAFVVVAFLGIATALVLIVRSIEMIDATYIDDPEILTVIEHECDKMTKTVNSLTVTGSPHHQAVVIRKQNEAAQRMVDAVLALDPDLLASDEPTLAWTADWEQLIIARSQYADQVELGAQPDLREPTDADGNSILERMDWATDRECVVPDALLDPYPELVEDV